MKSAGVGRRLGERKAASEGVEGKLKFSPKDSLSGVALGAVMDIGVLMRSCPRGRI